MQPREDEQKPLEIKRSREERKSAPISRACNLSTLPQRRGAEGAGSTWRGRRPPLERKHSPGQPESHPGKGGLRQSRTQTTENRQKTAIKICSQGA